MKGMPRKAANWSFCRGVRFSIMSSSRKRPKRAMNPASRAMTPTLMSSVTKIMAGELFAASFIGLGIQWGALRQQSVPLPGGRDLESRFRPSAPAERFRGFAPRPRGPEGASTSSRALRELTRRALAARGRLIGWSKSLLYSGGGEADGSLISPPRSFAITCRCWSSTKCLSLSSVKSGAPAELW